MPLGDGRVPKETGWMGARACWGWGTGLWVVRSCEGRGGQAGEPTLLGEEGSADWAGPG